MIELNTVIMFTVASLLLALAPGPDNIFVLTQSIANGKSVGMIITLGLCTGLIVHTTVVALGISVIFKTSMIAFNILKYLGAAYLLYLSWLAFRAPSNRIQISQNNRMSTIKYYRRGIIMNVTNPKVSIFFMAFLPQFTNPEKGLITLQLIFLGFIFIVATFLVFGSISQIAAIIGNWIIKTKNGQNYLNKISGIVFIALAVKLFFTARQ